MSFFKSCILILIIFVQIPTSYSLTLADPKENISSFSLNESYTEPSLKVTEINLEPYFNQDQSIKLNVTSKINSSVSLDQDNTHIIPSSPYHRNLQIHEPKSFRNSFDFSSILIPKLNNYGSGDLLFQATESNTKLNFAINDSTYTSYFSIPLDTAITGTEFLEFAIDDIAFDFNSGDFAFANLAVEFNNFNLLMVFEHSQSYIDFGFNQNSTDSIKILNSLISKTKINISDLVSLHNLNMPNLIKSMSWNIYSNNPYDFSATFSTLKFIGSIIPEVTINAQSYFLSANQIILLDPKTIYSIKTNTNYTFVEFQASVYTTKSIEEIFSINFNDFQLIMEGTIVLDESDLGSMITVTFPENLIVENINTSLVETFYKDNLLSFEYNQQSIIQFSAHFTLFENINYSIGGVSQGTTLKVTNFDFQLMGSKIMGPSNEIGNVLNANYTVEYFVPSNWDKGEIIIVVWFKNGGYSFFSRSLNLYPTKLISPISYTLNVGQRAQIPIIMQNLSSLEYRTAQSIRSYVQGDLFSIDNQNGITINPGDFTEGTHSILVNASHEGLASLVFELEIIINIFNPEILYTVRRDEVNKISVNFSITEIYNWSVSSFMNLKGEGINQTFEFWKSKFEIHLNNSDWTNSDLEFDLIIFLDGNLGFKYQQISVPPYIENPNSKSNSNDNNSMAVALSVIAFASGLGFVGYRFVKDKISTEKISF